MESGEMANRSIDISGQKFGRATVIEQVPNKSTSNRSAKWLCRCDCGNEFVTRGNNLRSGETQSCGCRKREQWIEYITKHGLCGTRIYTEWVNMKSRCLYESHASYDSYGGRGITICDEWMNDFQVFCDWAMANGYNDALTIERKNVNGNYEPDNCEWIPSNEQGFNKRLPKDNKSGHKGVRFREKYNTYNAFIGIGGQQKHLGTFDTYEKAVKAREDAEIIYFQKNNPLPKPRAHSIISIGESDCKPEGAALSEV